MKKIYFITIPDHLNEVRDSSLITIGTVSSVYKEFKSFVENTELLGFDLETTMLCEQQGDVILAAIGNTEYSYVFQHNLFNNMHKKLLRDGVNIFDDGHTIIGANLSFDLKWIKKHWNIDASKIIDVIEAERVIYKSFYENYDLNSVINRRLNLSLEKEVRNEFVGWDILSDVIKNRHVEYSGKDTLYLEPIWKKQKEKALPETLNYLHTICFPTVIAMVEPNTEGWLVNEEQRIKWSKAQEKILLKHNKWLHEYLNANVNNAWRLSSTYTKKIEKYTIKKQEVESTLPDIVDAIKVRVQNKTTHTKAYDKLVERFKRYKEIEQDVELFFLNPIPELFINWKSVVDWPIVLDTLGIVPEEVKKTRKDPTSGRVIKEYGPSIGTEARTKWLQNNIGHPRYEFMEHLNTYLSLYQNWNAFGEKWLEKYNINGRYYTHIRTESTETGRMASGQASPSDKRAYRFNLQQLPKVDEIRTSFIADDPEKYNILTIDLSQAELYILAYLSKDELLLSLLSDDMHSYLAEKCWRGIHLYRAGIIEEIWSNFEEFEAAKGNIPTVNENNEDWKLSQTLTVSKTHNKKLRTAQKAVNYGIAYGATFLKIAEALKITPDEGRVVVWVMENQLNKAFKYLNKNAEIAATTGKLEVAPGVYRYWPEARKAYMKGKKVSDRLAAKIGREAKNAVIQGTQAIMVKRFAVFMDRYFKKYKLDSKCKGYIHDEAVFQYNVNYTWFPEFCKKAFEWAANKYVGDNIRITSSYEDGKTWSKP